MASFLSEIYAFFMGSVEGLTHNITGILIAFLIGLYIYLKYNKVKPVDMGELVFKKEWEATTERLRLPQVKRLGLCSYPLTLEELKSSPIHQIKYDLIGEVIGLNCVGVRTSVKTLLTLTKKLSDTELKEFLDKNKENIDADNFWIVFAVERRVGGKWLFPKVSKTLLYAKPNQIIDLNSKDNVIRIRGFGITPQGQYELINDENCNINIKQLLKDKSDVIFDEITIGTLSKMGEFVENAIKLDATYRKDMAEKGIQIQPTAESQKVDT